MPLEHAAALIRQARRVVALTGAGISTPSGVPDFRSAEGIWRHLDPIQVASIAAFRQDPRTFFRWLWPLIECIHHALPNPAHLALAELERRGKLSAVITQNIDGLHQRAGSREVFELHGHLRTASCVECERRIPASALLAQAARGEVLRCACGGAFKPDVVLFGEQLPRMQFWLAQEAVDQCDLLLVAGSALEVAPASDLPLRALRRNARVIVINYTATHIDEHADVVLRDNVATLLPALLDLLDREAGTGCPPPYSITKLRGFCNT